MTNNELYQHLEDVMELQFKHVDKRFDRLEDELKTMKSRYVKLTIIIASLVTAGGQTIDFKALGGMLNLF